MDEELKKCLKLLEKQKQKARKANDLVEEANLCNIAGEKLADYRLFEEAIKEHEMELQLSESLDDTIAVAIAHRKIGECLCELQDFTQALFHQQKHLELSRKCQNLVEEQRALATIGRTLFQSAVSTSEMRKAQTAFLESLSICDQLRDIVKEKELLEMRARLYLNLGLVYSNLKNQKKGIKYIEKALTITVNHSLKETEYRCHFSIGEIKLSENHPAEALQCFERARKTAQHQGMKFEEADTLVQMGQALLQLGDFRGAKNILKKCYKTMKHGNMVDDLRSCLIKAIKGVKLLAKLAQTKDEPQMKACEDLGDLYSSVKCFSEAIHYYLKQLDLSRILEKSNHEKAVICFSIAQSYSDNRQYDKAEEYFHKELTLLDGKQQEQCDTWCNIAELYERAGKCFEEIEKAYNNALQFASQCENESRKRRLLKLLAELRRRQNTVENELEECSAGVKIEEDSEMSEEPLSVEESCDDDEDDDRLIQEEMEFSDSEEEQEGETSCTARSKRTSTFKRNEKGETVLHVAAIKGDYNLAKTSLEKGVSIDARDYCGWQPLHEACNHGNLAIVELLLDNGADINDPGGPHCRGMTPLHDAVQNAHVDVVKLLVSRGACVMQCNKDGHTPLDIVLRSIEEDNEDDDDDDNDPEEAEVREQLTRILRSATNSRKTSPATALRRRDKLDFSDDSDVESLQDFSETSIVPRRTEDISRKRKSSLLDLDSDEENIPRNSIDLSKAKSAKVSKNSALWSDDESQSRYGGKVLESPDKRIETSGQGIFRDDSDHSETSGESMSQWHVNELDSDPVDIPHSPQPSISDYSDALDIPQVLYNAPKACHAVTKDRQKTFQSRLSLNKSNRSSSSSWKSNTTVSTFDLGTLSTISKANKAVPGNNSSVKSSTTVPRTVSMTSNTVSKSANSTAYVDPVTGGTPKQLLVSKSQPALIPETADGWLIDDIPKRSGKRKRSGNILNMLSGSESSRDNLCMRSSSASSHTVNRQSDTSRRVSSTQGGHGSSSRNRLRQSRLIVNSGRSSPNDFLDDTTPEPATLPFSSVAASVPEAPMRLRVEVKDKVFLIPCPNVSREKKTVKWLAEQATFRYHSDTGLKPILSLFTTEGAALSPADLIADVLSNNELVNGTVESWDLPPLAERYKVSCLMVNEDVQNEILDVFERNPHSSSIEFSDMSLTCEALLPLFRSLQCHDQLVRLSLPGNRIGDNGLQHLISSLPYLCNLSVLVLSCNGITHKGLRHLASSLTADDEMLKVWSNLRELDISFNTITDTGASSLATMLHSCPDLQMLNIESCALGQNTFHQRSTFIEAIRGLKRLHYFNVSHNQVQVKGLTFLLSACTSVEILNISASVNRHTPAIMSVLADFLNEVR